MPEIVNGKLKLSSEERRRFFASDWPDLAGPGKPPKHLEGAEYKLSSRLAFTVQRVHRTKKGWRLEIKVFDDREERFKLLPAAASFPTTERGTLPDDLPPEEEIGYTRNPKRRTVDNLPAVPPEVQNVIDMRARLQHAQRAGDERAEELAKRQARSINEAIRNTLIQRARLGLPADSPAMLDLMAAIEAVKSEGMEEAA